RGGRCRQADRRGLRARRAAKPAARDRERGGAAARLCHDRRLSLSAGSSLAPEKEPQRTQRKTKAERGEHRVSGSGSQVKRVWDRLTEAKLFARAASAVAGVGK